MPESVNATLTVSEGLSDLQDQLADLVENTSRDKVEKALKDAAEQIASDGRKLPYPLSKIMQPGYTHLVRSITAAEGSKSSAVPEYVIGWGKAYGGMVEKGTKKFTNRAHLVPMYERNKEQYLKIIVNDLGF